jgi:hypothetical protein
MWIRSAVLATARVSVSFPALARSGLSETRKWNALLPTVHTTTDCLAQGIVASPTALSYARQENWLEAVKSLGDRCNEVGRTLVAEHDRLYGPGTGKALWWKTRSSAERGDLQPPARVLCSIAYKIKVF